MSLLSNKVVAITGASRGIGRACAIECAKHGASGLILHYLGDEDTEAEIKSLKAEVEAGGTAKATLVPGDIGDPKTSAHIVEAGVAAFGRIDVLVSNAGICPFAEFLTMPHSTWERTRQVNLDGSFYIVQAVANQMKTQTPQGGSIVAISSISALVGGELQCHYTPTKAGILSLMQSCAVALGKYNIRSNAVLPGTIATDINKEDLADTAKRDYMVKRTALGRLGVPDDIAGPVVFLASDLAKYVTGASLLVDGGLFPPSLGSVDQSERSQGKFSPLLSMLNSTDAHFIDSNDGTRIWAEQTGDSTKPVVIFIHGWTCTSLAFEKQWNDPQLLANLHLLRYDVRGHGQSGQPLTQEAYASIRHAEDFKAVCDEFNAKKPFVAGWSMGGVVPADIATAYGVDYISGVILMGGYPYKSMFKEIENSPAQEVVPDYLSIDLNIWYQAVKAFVDTCLAHPEDMPLATKYAWIGGTAQLHPSVRKFTLPRVQDQTKLLEASKTLPYLVCQGTLDLHIDCPKLVQFMKKTFSKVEIRVIEDCGHSPFWEKAEEVNEAILRFVNRINSE